MSAPVTLLIFERGGERFGADASQVLRIEGGAVGPERRVVFDSDAGERTVAVDEVLGVYEVPGDSLRRLPPCAQAAPNVMGFWLDGERPVVLVDLSMTSNSNARW